MTNQRNKSTDTEFNSAFFEFLCTTLTCVSVFNLILVDSTRSFGALQVYFYFKLIRV